MLQLNHYLARTFFKYGMAITFGLITLPLFADWIEQGPGPILHGGNTTIPPNNPIVGAINRVVLDPRRPNTAYLATVNGGVWKSNNINHPNPLWEQLTDLKLPGLSIGSLAISPVDHKILFAGTGTTSSDSFLGSPGFGVARSLDGGRKWEVLADKTFANQTINSIVPTKLHKGKVVLAATLDARGGVFRSKDLGDSFKRLSGDGFSNLPDQGVSSLVADPSNSLRFYAGVPGNTDNSGVYRSDDGGKTWSLVNFGLTRVSASIRILLAVHANSQTNTNVVYAMIIKNGSPQVEGVFRSVDQGEHWTSMAPVPDIFPGLQGSLHGAIVADPSDPNVVFIAGDRQDNPSTFHCNGFTANVYRGNAALLPGDPWENVVCVDANNTSPHPDARGMTFDLCGNILFACDGGVYKLNQANNPSLRNWSSLNGDVRPTEMHSVAYDSLSKIVLGGNQDNGTSYQREPGSFTWLSLQGGDGGDVAIDSDQSAHPGISIRYSCAQTLGRFSRSSWNAANQMVSPLTPLELLITSGPGTGETLHQFDHTIQFFSPYILNAITPNRMLIGTAYIYESMDMGDTLENLGFQSQFITAFAYGGRLCGVDNPDVFYAGTTTRSGASIGYPRILKRVNLGESLVSLDSYPGGSVRAIAMDPQNYQRVFVADSLDEVWSSMDGGITWQNLTLNLRDFTKDIRTLAAFYEENKLQLTVGGLDGVFILSSQDSKWKSLRKNLPHGLVFDLHFNEDDQLLVASILGRGAWILNLSDEQECSR